MRHVKLIFAGFVLSVLALVSCNNDENSIPENKGRLNVLLTDSPFPIELISSTWVTIDKVEIRQHSESDEDSFIVIAEGEMEFDLLELTNGITEQLASVDLEAGVYDMIRLHVVDATVVLANGTEFDLTVPSGSSSGLKIKISPAIQLAEGQTSDVLLDFDVSKSFVAKGNINGQINGFNFKPVVRGIFLEYAGRIEGNVADTTGAPLENASVQVLLPEDIGEADDDEMDDEEMEEDDDYKLVSTFSDVDGRYKLIGIPEGTYTVICELEGYQTDTIQGVAVTSGNSTKVDFELE